jgi:DNA-binding response OmpR family regulator
MSSARPILLVEDDAALGANLAALIGATGEFQATLVASLADAAARIAEPGARFDLIILDVTLPDGDGRAFCADLRGQGHGMPVIILTGASGEDDVVRGLEAGANDYVSKPFRGSELIARINAQLRSFDVSEDAVFAIGPYTFQPSARMLMRPDKGQKVRLTSKESDILRFLIRRDGQAVPRDVLLSEVWGYNGGVTTHTLETHVYRLRQKLEVDPNDCRLLVTVPGGYALHASAQGPARAPEAALAA